MTSSGHARLLVLAVAACLATGPGRIAGAQVTSAGDPPRTVVALASTIRAALLGHDIAALEKMVSWDGASDFKHRMVLFEMRKAFGRPIRSVVVEPFPADAMEALAQFGAYKPNIDVKSRVRVVFDEPAAKDGATPDMVFLAGQQGEVCKIALVNPITPTRHQ